MTGPLPVQSDDTTRVYDYAQSVLSLVNDAALELLVDLPTKQYATSGEAAYDCEQVAVTGVSLTTGLPASDAQSLGIPTPIACTPVWSINFDITIVRCGPKVQRSGTVLADDLNSAFLRTSADIAVLIRAIDKLVTLRQFGNVIASMQMGPPQGDMVSTVATVTGALP